MEDVVPEETVSAPRPLVLVGCSRRKVDAPGLLPAIERYDGPVFRLLRRFLRTSARPISIYILSAAYGLIPADHPIPWYDCQMTTERAAALHPAVDESLRRIATMPPRTEIFICMGAVYREALPEIGGCVPAAVPVHIATGTIGRQLGLLHDWLYGEPPASVAPESGTIRIRGMVLNLTADEALAIGRRALDNDGRNSGAFHSWYVSIDGQRVAPKWFVSHLIGLPVSAFSTGEARRVLTQVGIEVHRL